MAKQSTSNAALVTASADKKPAGRKVLDEVTIRPVGNGYHVKTRHRSEGKEAYMSDYAPDEQVFTDHAAMMEHVKSQTGGSASKKAKEEKD